MSSSSSQHWITSSASADGERRPLLLSKNEPTPYAAKSPSRLKRSAITSLVVICVFGLIISFSYLLLPDLLRRRIGPISTGSYCTKRRFKSTFRDHPIFGAKILSIQVEDVHDYDPPANPLAPLTSDKSNLDFCSVTVTYTHPGYNNEVKVIVWLPDHLSWNHRFQGTGGAGYAAGLGHLALAGPVSLGFAAAATDGGLPSWSPRDWALVSPGNVDFPALRNFGSTALHDMTVIGKAITKSYYGRDVRSSVWNGCSTGGRQGLMIAQRYPNDYDGILASAPAISWPSYVVASYWPQLVMQMLDSYPQPCELEFITSSAISACDELDGVKDGIVSLPDQCHFDPTSLINHTISCPNVNDSGATTTLSSAAAHVAIESWRGPRSPTGDFLWHGLWQESSLLDYATTECDYSVEPPSCSGSSSPIAGDWVQLFLKLLPMPSDPQDSVLIRTHAEHTQFFHTSNTLYNSFVGSNDADLSEFAKAGGKMITWHGLADSIIPSNGTRQYFESVIGDYQKHASKYSDLPTEASPRKDAKSDERSPLTPASALKHVHEFYRYYEAPGVGHCGGGPGPYPRMCWDSVGALDQLIDWVENGVEPDVLHAVSEPQKDTDGEGDEKVWKRPLCMWPKVAFYKGRRGEEREEKGWVCKLPAGVRQ